MVKMLGHGKDAGSRWTDSINNQSLDSYLAGDTKFEPGKIVDGVFVRINSRENPVVLISGTSQYVEIVYSNNTRFGNDSNELRQRLLDEKSGVGNVKVKLLGESQYNCHETYAGVCFLPKTRENHASPEHKYGFTSDRIFNAVCGEKDGDFSFRLNAYPHEGESLFGFLRGMVSKRWYYYIDRSLPSEVVSSECHVSDDWIYGGEKSRLKTIGKGDSLLARVIGDNRFTGKQNITYFFEPVILIRKEDEAFDFSGRNLFTGIVDKNGERKDSSYARGDTICDLPILQAFNTNNLGVVGIGYIPRAKDDDSSNFKLQKVWVINGADHVGNYIPQTQIVSNKGTLLAKL